jgi:hypothetical protein
MDTENGNGELKQLLGIKRAYRKDLADAEERLKADFDRNLAEQRKHLKDQYLEKVVDTVFGESVPAAPRPEPVVPSSSAEPESPKCPECGSPVDPMDKFCAECAFPLTEEKKGVDMSEFPGLSPAGGQRRTRRRQ